MPLCRLLEIQGASTLRLPAVEIKPIGNRRETAAQLGALAEFDVIIFTSANAVRFGASLLDQQRDLTLAAIGPATARALNHAGYRVAVLPPPRGTFDSEAFAASDITARYRPECTQGALSPHRRRLRRLSGRWRCA